MANKYGGGKFNCANCPYSNTSDARCFPSASAI